MGIIIWIVIREELCLQPIKFEISLICGKKTVNTDTKEPLEFKFGFCHYAPQRRKVASVYLKFKSNKTLYLRKGKFRFFCLTNVKNWNFAWISWYLVCIQKNILEKKNILLKYNSTKNKTKMYKKMFFLGYCKSARFLI